MPPPPPDGLVGSPALNGMNSANNFSSPSLHLSNPILLPNNGPGTPLQVELTDAGQTLAYCPPPAAAVNMSNSMLNYNHQNMNTMTPTSITPPSSVVTLPPPLMPKKKVTVTGLFDDNSLDDGGFVTFTTPRIIELSDRINYKNKT